MQRDTNDYDALGREVLAGAYQSASFSSSSSSSSSSSFSSSSFSSTSSSDPAAQSSYGRVARRSTAATASAAAPSDKLTALLGALNFPADTPPGARWGNLDPVFRHPETDAMVYIGNTTAAQTKSLLLKHNITRVVNCKDPDDPNFHEGDPNFEYLRFPIAYHWRDPTLRKGGNAGTLEYFGKLFDWVDAQLASGKSVLIHCLAGAHRAGTTGVSYVMHAGKLGKTEATAIVQRQRPVVCPIGSFPALLTKLDTALREEVWKHA